MKWNTSEPMVSLRPLAQAQGILLGTAVNVQALRNDQQYQETLRHHFTCVTPENAMKFMTTHPTSDSYHFEDGDTIVHFAKDAGMQIRGHTLLWPQEQLPAWIAQGMFARPQLLSILHDYIVTVVQHYRESVQIWDVVNEAINEDGSFKDCIWLRGIGPDYIGLAFQWAHEANPEATLFYNDYQNEDLGKKSNAVYELVRELLQQGVPIGGVGFELHLTLENAPRSQEVLANMNRLALLGLQVHITELDVQTWGTPGTQAEKLTAQATIYAEMLQVCLIANNCKAFIMWGFTDRYSWIPDYCGHPDVPLLFDDQYRPKPAYYALIQALGTIVSHSSPS